MLSKIKFKIVKSVGGAARKSWDRRYEISRKRVHKNGGFSK
jgi:hypothetical protein